MLYLIKLGMFIFLKFKLIVCFCILVILLIKDCVKYNFVVLFFFLVLICLVGLFKSLFVWFNKLFIVWLLFSFLDLLKFFCCNF